MGVSAWVYVHHVFVMSMLARRDIGSFNMRVIDRCKPLIDAGIQTLGIWKKTVNVLNYWFISPVHQYHFCMSSPKMYTTFQFEEILLFPTLLWEIGWMPSMNLVHIYKVILDIYLLFFLFSFLSKTNHSF